MIIEPKRTDNRIRSPRLTASGERNNVSKGSRQISSVTSEEGMALKVGLEEAGPSPTAGRFLPGPRLRP